MSAVAEIAEAVKDALNGHAFSMEFEAARDYVPLFELPEMADLHVTVVPAGLAMQMHDRARALFEVDVQVGVQKKLEAADVVEIDALMMLVEEIADFLRTGAVDGATWIAAENRPLFLPEHLSEMRQFTGVLTLTYRVVKE